MSQNFNNYSFHLYGRGKSVAGEEVAGVDAGGDVGEVGGGAVGQDGA